VVTGFVFHTMLVASAFMLVKGKPDDRFLNLIQVVNALLFIVLPVASRYGCGQSLESER